MLQRKSFWISFAAMLAVSVGFYLSYLSPGENIDNAPDCSVAYFLNGSNLSVMIVYLSLFLVVLPYANAYVLDKKNNTQLLYQAKDRRWYLEQLSTAALGAFLILFIPAVFNILLNGITFHANGNLTAAGIDGRYTLNFFDFITGRAIVANVIREDYYLKKLVYFYPQLYNLAYAFLYAVSGSILAGFAYAVSLFLGKIRILVYIVPFAVVYFIQSFDVLTENMMRYCVRIVYPDYVNNGHKAVGLLYPAFWGVHLLLLAAAVFLTYRKGKDDEL